MAEREEELKTLFFFLIVLFIKHTACGILVPQPGMNPFIRHTACGILVPQPGIEPMLPPLGAQSPNHWTTRESP